MENALERRRQVLGPTYSLFYREPVHMVRAEGVWMYDADGLLRIMAEAGFCGARTAGFLESAIPSDALRRVERADRIVNGAGVVVEARKA